MAKSKEELRKQLGKLVQYKNNPKALEDAIEKKYNDELFLEQWDYNIELKEEKEYYFTLVHKYLQAGEIENNSDKELLKQLCYLELVNLRIRKNLNKFATEGTIAPGKELYNLNENIQQIVSIKKQLGLASEEDSKANDFVKVMSNLQERFKKWVNKAENRASYQCKCPYCKELILIRRRIDKEKDVILEHPWFVKGGLLFNKEIFRDYQQKVITKEQVIRYLNCTEDYVDWLFKNYRLELFEELKEKGENYVS